VINRLLVIAVLLNLKLMIRHGKLLILMLMLGVNHFKPRVPLHVTFVVVCSRRQII